MTSSEMTHLAQKWFDAFNAHDLEGIISLYDNKAEHFSPKLKVRQPETGGWVRGEAELREWWRDSFRRLPGLHYQPTNYIATENAVFMEYIRTVPGEEPLRVGEVLEASGGRIVRSRVYHG
jgi:hypothetical protein